MTTWWKTIGDFHRPGPIFIQQTSPHRFSTIIRWLCFERDKVQQQALWSHEVEEEVQLREALKLGSTLNRRKRDFEDVIKGLQGNQGPCAGQELATLFV